MKTSNGASDSGQTWTDLCHDPRLQHLPYKIELNGHGQIILSPTRNKHGSFQGKIVRLLGDLLPQGEVAMEIAIDCAPEGTRVADVVWASAARWKIIEDEFSCSVAPEICVEVWSPSNSPEEMEMKRPLYLSKGALEFWYCDALGDLTHFDHTGEIPHSKLCPQFPKRVGA